jgi:3'(2'), 5'-bisphosphate nucleotidase
VDVLESLPPLDPRTLRDSHNIYLIGFQRRDAERAEAVTQAGLKGFGPDEMTGSIYSLLCSGEFGGSLIHSPNVYDFPVSMHLARILGGDAVWVHDGRSVDFSETWLDDRADMLRLPGVIACAVNPRTLQTLAALARDWNPNRYAQ